MVEHTIGTDNEYETAQQWIDEKVQEWLEEAESEAKK
jgi:predicted transcriptional regulator